MTDTATVADTATDEIFTADSPAEPTATGATVEIDAPLFREQMEMVCKAAASRSVLPALNTVRLTTEGQVLIAKATDSAWGVQAVIPVRAHGHLDLCAQAGLLNTLVQTFTDPEAKVLLETLGHDLTVRCGKSKSRLHTISPEDFPSFPNNRTILLEFGADRLKQAADLTAWAASKEVASPLIGNVCVTVKEDPQDATESVVRFEATDRFVIATWDGFDDVPPDRKLGRATGLESRFIVPGKVLTELGRVAGRLGEKRVTLSVCGPDPSDPNHVALNGANDTLEFTVYARCHQRTNDKGQDTFPDLKKMVDRHYEQGAQQPGMVRVVFDARRAQASLDRILPFASDVLVNGQAASSGKSVRLTASYGLLELESKTQENEEAYDAIEADTGGTVSPDDSKRIETRFGSDLFDKVLKAVCAADPEGGIMLQIPSPLFPSVFTPIGTPGFRGLISPLDPGVRG